jgi:hypothetical protein
MTVFQRLILMLLLTAGLSSCKTNPNGTSPYDDIFPNCIKGKIKEYEGLTGKYQPAYIKSYRYKGATVYYVPARCCDQMSEVLDAECNVICRPEGGITGKGDGKCSDFLETATEGKVIWEPKN